MRGGEKVDKLCIREGVRHTKYIDKKKFLDKLEEHFKYTSRPTLLKKKLILYLVFMLIFVSLL